MPSRGMWSWITEVNAQGACSPPHLSLINAQGTPGTPEQETLTPISSREFFLCFRFGSKIYPLGQLNFPSVHFWLVHHSVHFLVKFLLSSNEVIMLRMDLSSVGVKVCLLLWRSVPAELGIFPLPSHLPISSWWQGSEKSKTGEWDQFCFLSGSWMFIIPNSRGYKKGFTGRRSSLSLGL